MFLRKFKSVFLSQYLNRQNVSLLEAFSLPIAFDFVPEAQSLTVGQCQRNAQKIDTFDRFNSCISVTLDLTL